MEDAANSLLTLREIDSRLSLGSPGPTVSSERTIYPEPTTTPAVSPKTSTEALKSGTKKAQRMEHPNTLIMLRFDSSRRYLNRDIGEDQPE
jgi:hypothetical protein